MIKERHMQGKGKRKQLNAKDRELLQKDAVRIARSSIMMNPLCCWSHLSQKLPKN